MGGGIPEGLIQRIKESQNIVDVVSGYLSLKKAGQNYTGLCPFHSEKTPSFVVSPSKQLFHCFGCGAGGDIIHFLMKHDSLTFVESVKTLAQRAGIPVATEKFSGGTKPAKDILYRINEDAARFYHRFLTTSSEAKRAREYLLQRGIKDTTIEDFLLGFAPDGWESLSRHLLSRGYSSEDGVKVGLVTGREKGNGYYDRFRGRIIFPIFDLQRRVIGFGGRLIPPVSTGALDGGGPKYLNSPETPVFQKGDHLFGLDKAREGIREQGFLIVVEGYMDAITAHQAGLTPVVATLGTAVTPAHVDLIRRFTKDVVLTFDADPAGVKAVLRTWDIVRTSGLHVRVLPLPEGEDPDSFIKVHGKEAFMARVSRAPELIEFLLEEKLGKTPPASIGKKTEIAEECLEILRNIPNRIERDLYIRKVAERLGITEALLGSQLRVGLSKNRGIPVERPELRQEFRVAPGGTGRLEASPSSGFKAEETLASLLLQYKTYRGKTRSRIEPEDVSDPILSEIIRVVMDPAAEEMESNELIEAHRNAPWAERLSGLFLMEAEFENIEKVWRDAIATLQRRRIDQEMSKVEKELGTVSSSGSEEKVVHLLRTQQRLARQKKGLYEKY